MRLLRLVGMAFACLFVADGLVNAQIDELRAKVEATELVRKTIGADASHQFRATRREDWEDTLFHLQIKIKGRIAKAAYFFEVTESGYFVLSPKESVHVSTVDGERFWVVAVATSAGSVYGLHGFSNGEAEFRRLMAEARLSVRSEADAEADALLCFATIKDPRQQTLVFRSRDLRRKVEDYFASRLQEQKADNQVNGWWRGFLEAKLGGRLGVRSHRVGDGYEVAISHTRADNNRIGLAVSNLRVSRTGACDVIGTSQMYR